MSGLVIFVRALFVLGAVFLSFISFFYTAPTSFTTRVTACDVGQGDAILLQHGSVAVLIDTGPNSAILNCLSQKLPFWKKNIDLLILTHSDWDHIGGVESVLSSFRVDHVWRTSWSELSASGQRVEQALDSVPTTYVHAGEVWSVPGLSIRALSGENFYENHLSLAGVEDTPNNRSVAVWVGAESFGFLGLGDLDCPGELAVMGVALLNEPQILKVSHHGSKSSSCHEFLKKLRPETAIISSGGGNSYGHPHPLPLENLTKMGVFPLRTDQLGTFTLESVGGQLRFQGETSAWE